MKKHILKLFCLIYLNFIFKTNGSKPDFLIIGTMKCGTTSLYEYLIQHPQVASAKKKEVHFFDLNFKRGLNWYLKHFPKKSENQITGEASPFYFFHPLVAQRVKNLFPNIKIIVLLCDPAKRAISHYFHNLKNKNTREKLSIEQAIKMENKRVGKELKKLSSNKKFNIQNIQGFSYLTRGIYIDQIKRWRSYFAENQILIINSADLFKDPAKNVNEVFEFLGLEKYELKEYSVYNKNKNKKDIKKETKDKLYKFFKKYNEELEKYLGRKFNWNNK